MVSQVDHQLTVRKALLFYRDHLVSEQEVRQQSLARKGKSPASVQDDATELAFEKDLASIDALLDAQHVEASITTVDSAADVSSPSTNQAPTVTAIEDDEPYLNPFTGLLVIPETANGPGSSNSRGRDVTREQFNISNELQEIQHHNFSTPVVTEAPKESNLPITSVNRVPGSPAEPRSAANASPSTTDSFSIYSSSLESRQKSISSSEATTNSHVAGWSVWNTATSAAKSAATYVFRMETIPHTPGYPQTSASLSNLPAAGSDFVFPLKQDASGTWKRLPPPPSALQSSIGLPPRSSLSKRLTGPSLTSLSNKTTPSKKAEFTGLPLNAQQDNAPHNSYAVLREKHPVNQNNPQPGNVNRPNRNRLSWDSSKLPNSDVSGQLPPQPTRAVPSTISGSQTNTLRQTHQATAKANSQPLQQQQPRSILRSRSSSNDGGTRGRIWPRPSLLPIKQIGKSSKLFVALESRSSVKIKCLRDKKIWLARSRRN